MASSYSNLLRFEKMAKGDQNGTWGSTLNNQLELIEDAIAGFVSVAFAGDANDVLTTGNGTTDEARNATIRLTGALTAARDMVIPASFKLYVVENKTTGGFAVNIKTSGGAGVSIPNGTRVLLYCDGVDCFEVGAPAIPTGMIGYHAANAVPANWLKADGTVLLRTAYPALFAAISTTFNTGGELGTQFRLPDLRGIFVRGFDDGRGIDVARAFGSSQTDTFASHVHTGTVDSGGAHTHTGTVDSGGAHTHTGTTVSDGSHTHTLSITSDGAHTHNIAAGSSTVFGSGSFAAVRPGIGSTATDSAGSHAHAGSSAASAGAHTHTFTTDSGGAHTHTFTTASGGAHTHTFTSAAAGSGAETRPRNVALLACIKS